jgi:hypothetical protein
MVKKADGYIAAPKKIISVELLEALAAAGNDGMSFTECQRFVFYAAPGNQGRCYDTDRDQWRPSARRWRGWWCTELLGGHYYGPGLLKFFAVKGADGRYRRNKVQHNGHPFAVMSARPR